jgi:hypothetical protein
MIRKGSSGNRRWDGASISLQLKSKNHEPCFSPRSASPLTLLPLPRQQKTVQVMPSPLRQVELVV